MSVGNFWQLFSSQGGVTRIVPFVSPVLEITRKITGKAKKRNMCVSGYISKKIRVVIFPEFNKKHNKCIACPCLPEVYNEKRSVWDSNFSTDEKYDNKIGKTNTVDSKIFA